MTLGLPSKHRDTAEISESNEIMLPQKTSDEIGGAQKLMLPRTFAAVVAGNALEVFDFIVYAQFAVYIGRAFFPASSPFASLLASFAVFGVGFVFRPLGGIVIGGYADRHGRRPALILTIGLITVGTLGLALTPTYAQIGVAAPLIVVGARLVQGFALGGDIGPVMAYMLEAAPPKRQATYFAWQTASQGLAALTAGCAALLLIDALPAGAVEAWAWRVPFLLCVLLVPIAAHLRGSMPETAAARRSGDASPLAGLRTHMRTMALAVLVVAGHTVATYAALYMATYAIATLHFPASTALASFIAVGASLFAGSLLGGRLADRFGRRPVMLAPWAALVAAVVPLFLVMQAAPTATSLYIAVIVIAFLSAVSISAGQLTIAALLPRGARASGLAASYAVGVTLFGGTAQFVFTWLIGATGSPIAPAWYIAAVGVVAGAAMGALPETGTGADV